ncbi:MAG: biliverdin-producing heme oxygenase [Pacificimonas sp.]
MPKEGSLRHMLRRETRAEHDAVEAAMGDVDVVTDAGIERFCLVHELAARKLIAAGADTLPSENLVRIASKLLATDLHELGRASLPLTACPERGEPAGLTYVMAGSRLGNQIMLRHWRTATSSRVAKAGSYLTSTSLDEGAKAFLKKLDTVQLDRLADEGESILAGALLGFRLFREAAKSV